MNQQIEDYVKQARISGNNDEQIKQQLLAAGWAEELIFKSLNSVSSSQAGIVSNPVSSIPVQGSDSKTKRNKANKFAWIGFLSFVIFQVLVVFGNSPDFPNLQRLTPIFTLLSLVGVALLIYATVLELKAKNRSLVWLLIILILNIIGVAIIFMLSDESTAPAGVPVRN